MSDEHGPASARPIVAVIGVGVTGSLVARNLSQSCRVAVHDTNAAVAAAVARLTGGVTLDRALDGSASDLVVLCLPQPHHELAAVFVERGTNVVSVADDPDDVGALLALAPSAERTGARLAVGMAMAPGLSGLLAGSLARRLATVDEVHVAVHGTGGPACARQHHSALAGINTSWHADEWVQRPGGSGRELIWFPEPIGAHDCYRAALADPILLRTGFPTASRISARVSGTRRDRLTARLPMLAPPHSGGNIGAVRVDVRGADAQGRRESLIAGCAGRTGEVAAWVSAAAAYSVLAGEVPPGVYTTGTDPAVDAAVLGRAIAAGVRLQEFTGVA